MVYADRVETQWTLRLQLGVGTRVPLYCTAAGKMYLSSLRKQQRRNLVDHLERQRFTSLTIMDQEQLLADLKRIRKQDYSTDSGEYIEGMIAVAAPIRDNKRRVCGTVSFHAPVTRMSLAEATQYAPRLHEAAAELAKLV